MDMETERIRVLAASLNVPCVAIRAISDTATESIDPVVIGLVDDVGRAQVAKVIAAFARRPVLMRIDAPSRQFNVRASESLRSPVAIPGIDVVDDLRSPRA